MTTVENFRIGMEMGDLEAVATTLAPGVVLISPITERLRFDGRDEVLRVLRAVHASLREIRCVDEVGAGGTCVMFAEAAVNGMNIQQATLLQFDGSGEICEIKLFMRPLAALTLLAAELAPRLAPNRWRAIITGVLLRPMAVLLRLGEGLNVRLVRRAYQSIDEQ